MTHTLLVTGTASHVGKSTVVAGLCRVLSNWGYNVAPYKAQNMSNNARVALTAEGAWGEMGVSQYVQARAARRPSTVDMNPVLLKPRGDGESQLIVQGEAVDDVEAEVYYQEYWCHARERAIESYERLAETHDIIVAEGAGSPAEINLHDRDLANVETAEFTDADILLLADTERGGSFASLYGTTELAPRPVRNRLVGTALTKFRGDQSLLCHGVERIEDLTNLPVLGVLPYEDPGLPAEDTVSLPPTGEKAVIGKDEVTEPHAVTIAVPRLPRISNFTDLEPLARVPGVRVAYVPPESVLRDADAVVLPGSKNTVDDLQALQAAGFDESLRAFDGPVVGLCGGYQMLGERIRNAAIEGTGNQDEVTGIGLLPVETVFSTEKQVEHVTRTLNGGGPLEGAHGTVIGYEIHMGSTDPSDHVERPVGPNSAAMDRVLGTYLHGLFENRVAREAFLDTVYRTAGKRRPRQPEVNESPYDRAAALVEDHLDLAALGLGN